MRRRCGLVEDLLYSLNVIHVGATFLPHVGHVGGVGLRLAAQKSVLGHVERGVSGGDNNDRRTCRDKCSQTPRVVTTQTR